MSSECENRGSSALDLFWYSVSRGYNSSWRARAAGVLIFFSASTARSIRIAA